MVSTRALPINLMAEYGRTARESHMQCIYMIVFHVNTLVVAGCLAGSAIGGAKVTMQNAFPL